MQSSMLQIFTDVGWTLPKSAPGKRLFREQILAMDLMTQSLGIQSVQDMLFVILKKVCVVICLICNVHVGVNINTLCILIL